MWSLVGVGPRNHEMSWIIMPVRGKACLGSFSLFPTFRSPIVSWAGLDLDHQMPQARSLRLRMHLDPSTFSTLNEPQSKASTPPLFRPQRTTNSTIPCVCLQPHSWGWKCTSLTLQLCGLLHNLEVCSWTRLSASRLRAPRPSTWPAAGIEDRLNHTLSMRLCKTWCDESKVPGTGPLRAPEPTR